MISARAQGLAEFYTVEQIRGFWKAVLDATLEKNTDNIVINASAKPDGRSSQGISLSTQKEQEEFMEDCKAAIAFKTQATSSGPTYTDFSQAMIRV